MEYNAMCMDHYNYLLLTCNTAEDPEMFNTTIVIPSFSTNNGLANQALGNDDELQCTRFIMLSILSTIPEVFISPDSSIVIQVQDDEGNLEPIYLSLYIADIHVVMNLMILTILGIRMRRKASRNNKNAMQ